MRKALGILVILVLLLGAAVTTADGHLTPV